MSDGDRLRVMRMVLDQGADPDSVEVDVGGISSIMIRGTALEVARNRGDGGMMTLLLERGAKDLKARNR